MLIFFHEHVGTVHKVQYAKFEVPSTNHCRYRHISPYVVDAENHFIPARKKSSEGNFDKHSVLMDGPNKFIFRPMKLDSHL